MTISLNDSITVLKGVGSSRAALFNQLGIMTIGDLLFYFPFRFESLKARAIDELIDQEKVTLIGKVVTPPVVSYFGRNKSRIAFKIAVDDYNVIQVVFFNQPYLKNAIQLGDTKAFFGKWDAKKQTIMGMRIIKLTIGDDEEATQNQTTSGVYHTVKGLKQSIIEKTIQQAIAEYSDLITEIIPNYLNDKYRMMPLKEAVIQLHQPKSDEDFKQAQRKIIFQEFYLYEWQLQAAMARQHQERGVRVFYEVSELKAVIDALPYDLTHAQKVAVNEICYDLMAPYPMKRMLQGDVGSGKTLVAFLSMIASALAGYQAVLMVPTEILAKQHVESFNKLFERVGYRAELLVSGTPSKEKTSLLMRLENGACRFVIGTHALIQPNVSFNNLGVAIIDEQHRFGVGQRQALLNKRDDISLNLLQMTATPIPRTLALSLYGEMSVSTIDERPKGRLPIVTQSYTGDEIDEVYAKMYDALKQTHQVYYVLPLIESSEHMEQIENVLEVCEKLAIEFPNYEIEMLHGQMTKQEQEDAMTRFKHNDAQILVATTMVEVGVDVANATVMVIQSAERFGLSQLHQLRGRVGRSDLQSYCYLIANPTTDQGKKRIQILVEEQDGFNISEEDLKLRGMGDLLGRQQSGLPQFHYANIFDDAHILKVARDEVHYALSDNAIEISEIEHERVNRWLSHSPIEV